MSNDAKVVKQAVKPAVKKADDGTPKFGRLLAVLVLCVLFCVFMTWLMAEVFPNFPNFG